MKTILVLLLLLIPLAYAQNTFFEARKASLDLNANEFIMQMNTVISFSSNKSADASNLTAIKASFEAKLAEALRVKTLDELKAKEKGMKDISRQFKDRTREKFKEDTVDLKIELFKAKQSNKERFKGKIDKLNSERRKLIGAAYDKRISEIKAKIEADKTAGKESRIQKVLLEKFQKSESNLNETDFIYSGNIGSGLIDKTINTAKDAWSFLTGKIKTIGEEK